MKHILPLLHSSLAKRIPSTTHKQGNFQSPTIKTNTNCLLMFVFHITSYTIARSFHHIPCICTCVGVGGSQALVSLIAWQATIIIPNYTCELLYNDQICCCCVVLIVAVYELDTSYINCLFICSVVELMIQFRTFRGKHFHLTANNCRDCERVKLSFSLSFTLAQIQSINNLACNIVAYSYSYYLSICVCVCVGHVNIVGCFEARRMHTANTL